MLLWCLSHCRFEAVCTSGISIDAPVLRFAVSITRSLSLLLTFIALVQTMKATCSGRSVHQSNCISYNSAPRLIKARSLLRLTTWNEERRILDFATKGACMLRWWCMYAIALATKTWTQHDWILLLSETLLSHPWTCRHVGQTLVWFLFLGRFDTFQKIGATVLRD